MSGKKIDRKKQSLLSRAAKRRSSIKKLTRKPVIRLVDLDAIKESFKKEPHKQAEVSQDEMIHEKKTSKKGEHKTPAKKKSADSES
jgi:hypothetical protein